MAARPTTPSYLDAVDQASAWLVGGGILTLALFPLVLPALALIAIAALPLVLVALVGMLAWALMTVPVRLVRRASVALRSRDRRLRGTRAVRSSSRLSQPC